RVMGAHGQGVLHISYLTLASVSHLGVIISGNGGPMDYKAAADFLALGCRTVQFCTMPTKYGLGIYNELCEGVSHLMLQRGIKSVYELIGRALPDPITDFMHLSAEKKISQVIKEKCISCGNCTRCPYLAITMGSDGIPNPTDASKCIGCSICALKCPALAIVMRERSPEEKKALVH
ncbi:MAG: 4Fe-4S binding protein, partial [Thermoplasmata archaeon]